MQKRTRRAPRVQAPIRSKTTRRRKPRPPFVLAAEGPGITAEHRRTGKLLAETWERLSPEALREIAEIIRNGMNGKGEGQ